MPTLRPSFAIRPNVTGKPSVIARPSLSTPGADGADGREIEIRTTDTAIQWRYVGGSWTNVILLSELIGPTGATGAPGADGSDGTQIELQKTATHIQWRYIDGTWINLVALSDITGQQGPQGSPGIVQSVNGQSVANVVLNYSDVGAAPALGTDDNYVTDAEKIKLSNLSGTNTGDQTLPTRDTLGIDTDDSPQFSGINLGHASDTTISRVSAGVAAIDGKNIYVAGGDDVALADGGTGASDAAGARTAILPAKTGNALKVLRVNSGETDYELATPSGGSALQAYDYIISKSGSDTIATRTSDGAVISTNANASVPIQAAIDALTAGGDIYIKAGTYSLTSALSMAGDGTIESPMKKLHGAGVQSTILVPGTNVDGIAISEMAKVSIKDLAIYPSGTGDGISSTTSNDALRAFWQSEFRNIYIYPQAAHTGWGMNLDNPFRSVFENIEMNQVGNGLKMTAVDQADYFNPGDLIFSRSFIELVSATSGTAIHLSSPYTGSVNQCIFDMVEMYAGGTNQVGILIDGAAGANHNNFRGINSEQFKTVLDIEYGMGNRFDFNYIVVYNTTGTTYFKTTANASGNRVSCKYLDTPARSVAVVNDANTDALSPNVFEDIYMIGSATATTFTTTAATILREIRDNAAGGSDYGEQLSGHLNCNGKNILDVHELRVDASPDTNSTANGPTTNSIQAGATISAFECVYLGSGGKWLKADADGTATADKMLAIAMEAKVDTEAMLVALPGSFIRYDTWNWTIGGAVYLSTTDGGLTQTAPSATDDVIRVVGYAVTADILYFNPETGVVHT